MRKRCSRCGKKVPTLADGTISSHPARMMLSAMQPMSRPDLDDEVRRVDCPGGWKVPHVGRWRGKVGWVR